MMEELKAAVGPGEKILYEGKPDKKCYIFESIFNPLLPLALLWGIADFTIIKTLYSFSKLADYFDFDFDYDFDVNILFIIIPFILLHMMPVWIYLFGVLFTIRRYKNTAYIVTDNAVYTSSGIFTHNINTKPFAELSHVDLHRGFFDRMFNVGDIFMTSSQLTTRGRSTTIVINSISNYIDVYNLVKKLQTDIYTDVVYPNAKRPTENPGYHTQY